MRRRTASRWSICALLPVLLACAPATKQKILSTFFDGVPTAEERALAEARAESLATAAALAARSPATQRSSPAADSAAAADTATTPGTGWAAAGSESLRTWDEVLRGLPKTGTGDLDWVRAITAGVIAPRPSRDEVPPGPPYGLDTFAPKLAKGRVAPWSFDVKYEPKGNELFKVVFPHSAHSLWLNCTSCHPGIRDQKTDMAGIFRGEFCGKCHGKVAFDPRRDCTRCHVNLLPGDPGPEMYDLATARTAPVPASGLLLARGKTLYRQACAVCHGDSGNGRGKFTADLDPKPRDFTTGKIKFRSTFSDFVATDYDLFRIITKGIPGTSMPRWSMFSYEDRWALVHFIKAFSPRYANAQEKGDEQPVPDPPPTTPQQIAEGADLYKQAGCNACHGDNGGGNGPSAPTLVDDWGNPARPYSFIGAVPPKGGGTSVDLYRTIMTGVQGTPMPNFGQVFQPEQAWAVVRYLESLRPASSTPGVGMHGNLQYPRVPRQDDVPAATFPHWFHRVRFRCSACHPQTFNMQMNSTPMTMDAMREGAFCAECHNGKVAWEIGFTTCVRCHKNP